MPSTCAELVDARREPALAARRSAPAAAGGAWRRCRRCSRASSVCAPCRGGRDGPDGEAMRLVADLLDQMQARVVRRKLQRLGAPRQASAAPARACAPRPWPRRPAPRRPDPSSSSTSRAIADLPLAAVDQDQVGQLALARHDLAVAPVEHLAHARRSRRPASIPPRCCSGGTRSSACRRPVVDHARRHGRLAHRVADVEALDALTVSGSSSACCSAASRASWVACAPSRCASAEPRVPSPPCRASAPLAAVFDVDLAPCARPAPPAAARAAARSTSAPTTTSGGTPRSR